MLASRNSCRAYSLTHACELSRVTLYAGWYKVAERGDAARWYSGIWHSAPLRKQMIDRQPTNLT